MAGKTVSASYPGILAGAPPSWSSPRTRDDSRPGWVKVAEPHAEALGELTAVGLVLCCDERDLGAERHDLAIALHGRPRLGHAQWAPVDADEEPRHRPVEEVCAPQLPAVLEKADVGHPLADREPVRDRPAEPRVPANIALGQNSTG
jgi:hypothetical protein